MGLARTVRADRPNLGKDRQLSLRVVIAEDEAIIRMDLRETLEEEGYDVVGRDRAGRRRRSNSSGSCNPTWRFSTSRCRVSIDGLQAAAVITDEHLCGVLILTAFSQREIVEQARDAGALAYLVKPFQKSDLVPAIEVAIGRFRELRNLSLVRSTRSGNSSRTARPSIAPRVC